MEDDNCNTTKANDDANDSTGILVDNDVTDPDTITIHINNQTPTYPVMTTPLTQMMMPMKSMTIAMLTQSMLLQESLPTMLPLMTTTLMQFSPISPNPCHQDHTVPTLAQFCLPDYDQHLQKIDILQGQLQQISSTMCQLIVALNDNINLIPPIPNPTTSETSPNHPLFPVPVYSYVATSLYALPDPLKPSMSITNNLLHVAPPDNKPVPNAKQSPANQPNPYKVPTFPCPCLGLPNIKHKAHTSQQFTTAFLHFVKNNYRPP